MADLELSGPQCEVVEVLVRCIGLTGVHRRPEQGDSIVLDLLPALLGEGPFCVRVASSGVVELISDEEAGIDERPAWFEGWRR